VWLGTDGAGDQQLLNPDSLGERDAITRFGHVLHGLPSSVTCPSACASPVPVAGTEPAATPAGQHTSCAVADSAQLLQQLLMRDAAGETAWEQLLSTPDSAASLNSTAGYSSWLGSGSCASTVAPGRHRQQ